MDQPKLLVANRGEIAIRIFRSARELGWTTVGVYTKGDASHASFADEAVELDSPSKYMDPGCIVEIATRTRCTHVHPGYGFLSESPALASLLAPPSTDYRPPITFVGPSVQSLKIASDKILARELACSLGVPVSPGSRVVSVTDVHAFTKTLGPSPYPIVIKALDGGGGRGIRIIAASEGVEDAFVRCLGESHSRQVFVEKALVGPSWKHIEVQIVGDGKGGITHLFERECSVQRRFQKVIEIAPSSIARPQVDQLLDAAVRMAQHMSYTGLGTFEFLVNVETTEWVFLEINPRIQVEHTVTEEIMDIDLVRVQLLLSLPQSSLSTVLPHGISRSLPGACAIQLRLVAEDSTDASRLSVGTIQASDVVWPNGHGVRVDTWLATGPRPVASESTYQWVVGTDFDSLLAKIIVRAPTLAQATAKAIRSLLELRVGNTVKTNVAVLAGVLKHPDWESGRMHTRWLEENRADVARLGTGFLRSQIPSPGSTSLAETGAAAQSSGMVLLPPGTSFRLTLTPDGAASQTHTISLPSIGHNAFPNELSGQIQTSLFPSTLAFSLAQSSSVQTSAGFELASPNDASHVPCPLNGKIVDLHRALRASEDSAPGGEVKEGEALVVISAMKMETVVHATFSGTVTRMGRGIEVGAVVGEGTLLCIIEQKSGTIMQSRL